MTTTEKVTAYIEKHPKWTEKLKELRAIINTTELREEVKWGAPAYLLDTKILIGLAALKNHMALWFHQGVFLKDEENVLLNAQENTTKALRQWRFLEEDTIDADLVLKYVNETIANCKAGKEIKPVKAKKVDMPELIKNQLNEDASFKKAYNNLTPGKQREYCSYILEAKRDSTKQSRLQKIIPMIKSGVGLHDKYKNC